MKRTFFPALFFLLLATRADAQTPAPAPVPERPVVVSSGEGVVKKTPDRAWVLVTAESRASSPREAQKANAEVMAAVLKKLRDAGLGGEAIQTRAYDLQPEYDFVNGRQRLRGYVARNTVEVRVDELTRVGEILDLAVSAGATNVGAVRFDLKDRPAVEREALRLAVDDARRRAEAAAAGAGMRVDRVVRIEEQRAITVPPPRPLMAMRAEMADAVSQPPIEAGEIEIRATVTLTAAMR